jgi:hypothetical protein
MVNNTTSRNLVEKLSHLGIIITCVEVQLRTAVPYHPGTYGDLRILSTPLPLVISSPWETQRGSSLGGIDPCVFRIGRRILILSPDSPYIPCWKYQTDQIFITEEGLDNSFKSLEMH